MAARASRLAKSETVEEYQLRHGHGGSSSRARGGYSVINESGPYRADGEHSYFRDLFTGRFRNNPAALDRLNRKTTSTSSNTRPAPV